jgi:hypothetical protein
LFCREFIDTHDPYEPDKLEWPELDDESLERLRAMPFWGEAVSTEQDVARKVQALVPLVSDPLIREAIALQGFEEGRHAALLQRLTTIYDIQVPPTEQEAASGNPEWDFIRVGYGECFDSFFAFGLYNIARDSGLFPRSLLTVVEPIVQEEARHILFFVNWIAYIRKNAPLARRPVELARSGTAMALQVWKRIQTARGVADDDMMLSAQDSLNTADLSPGKLLNLCVQEHDRRLGIYDRRLLRPRFVPAIARSLTRVLS